MTRRRSPLPSELEAFIEPRRVTRRLPAEMRARVLARAANPSADGGQLSPGYPRRADSPAPVRARPLVRLAVAASVVLAAGTVWAIVALPRQPVRQAGGEAHPDGAPARLAASGEVQERPAPGWPVAAPAPSPAPGSIAVGQSPVHRAHPGAPRDAFAVELALLQRAHTDYTHRDLTGALALLAEHARRFPHGRLAEEREALRVRSLLAAGRTAEAHRVATAFAAEFPRSALLQRLDSQSVDSESTRP